MGSSVRGGSTSGRALKPDLEAFRQIRANHDRKLDAGNVAFGQFKLIVTNVDGTTTVETLAQAGIASIDLEQSLVNQIFADGSSIDGEAFFTRMDGTTGAVDSVTDAADANGYAVQTVTTVNADGSTTVENRALNADGSLNNDTASTTWPTEPRAISYDDNGTGVIDCRQTVTDTANADGTRTETVSDFDGGGHLRDSTATTTAADCSTYIKRDTTEGINPDGTQVIDQRETRRVLTDGPSKGDTANSVADVSVNGMVIDSTFMQIGVNGLGRNVHVDHSGAGHYGRSTIYRTTFAADGTGDRYRRRDRRRGTISLIPIIARVSFRSSSRGSVGREHRSAPVSGRRPQSGLTVGSVRKASRSSASI